MSHFATILTDSRQANQITCRMAIIRLLLPATLSISMSGIFDNCTNAEPKKADTTAKANHMMNLISQKEKRTQDRQENKNNEEGRIWNKQIPKYNMRDSSRRLGKISFLTNRKEERSS